MDLHNMKRKELQKLCKEHNIPANLTNLDMVDKLSSFFKVQEKEEVPMRKTRSCLKNCDEMLSENESDVLKRKSKKVRFSPQNDVFQLGDKKSERDLVVGNKGGVGRVTRGRASLGKTVVTGPVVMKNKGKRAVQEVEEGDLVVKNEGGGSRVTRARAALGNHVVISSPVVMKKRAKRAVQEVEKKDLDVESKSCASRVTRARALLGEKVLIPSPVVMKKRGKSVVQEDEMGDSVVEHEGGASRVTRNRAGKQVLISSPVVMKKRGKRAVQEEKKSGSVSFQVVDFTSSDAEEENEMITVKFLRNRKVESIVSPKNIVRKSTQKRGQSINVDVSENKDAEADGGITQPKMGLRRSTRSVIVSEESEGLMDETDQKVSRKNLRQGTRQRASAKSSIEDADEKTVAGEISLPVVVTRQSKRNRMEFTLVEPSEENLGVTEKAGRRKITRSRNQFQAEASTGSRESETRDANEEAKEVVVQVKEPLQRSGRHDNTEHTNFANDSELPIKSDESTGYQTRHGTKRMSVMPQMKKAKIEKPVARNSGKKNVVVKDSPNESRKPIVLEKGSETGHIRRSKRNAVGDDSLVLSEDAKGSGSDIKKGKTKKRRRDTVLEEVPSQHTGKSVNTKAGNILEKRKEETPVASEPQARSGSRQKSFMHSAKKLNMSGNTGPSRTSGEKALPHHTREISMMPESSATGTRQSKTMAVTPRTRSGSEQLKTVAVTPRTRSGSGQKSFIHTNKKLRMSGNFGPDKTIGDKESPHQSRELSMVLRRTKTDLKLRGSKSKQTPVAHEHSKRFTRSALKGKIYQKESQSISKLPLSKVECSLPKVILASEGPLNIDVQSPYHEVDRSAVNLVSSPRDLPEDGTACSTPQGISLKTSSVDLNVQESEGPELINIHEASPSDPLKLQSDHAELEVEISAGEHAPVGRQTSYEVQSFIPKIAGCSTVPISDASNSCGGVDTCAILQDSVTATQANDKTPVQSEPEEGLDVAGDGASIDRNSVDDVISSLEQTSSKGMEVNPQTVKYVEPSSGEIANVVLEGSTVPEGQSMNQLPFPEDGCSAIPVTEIGDVSEDNTTATQQVKSSETNVASPHLVHLKTDNAAGEGYAVDTNALTDLSLVDQLALTRTKERPQLSKDVELISKGIDLNLVFQGPAIHEDEPVHQSPLAEVAEITDNPVTGNSDAGCLTQQEGPTEIDARSPPMVHPKSADHVDTIGDAGTIDADSVDGNLLNVVQMNLSEKREASKNYHVVAEGSTVDEEKLTAEVGVCGRTGQEHDIRNHSAEFAESDELDKDSRSAFKEDGEASFADLTNRTVSMIFTEEKDDTMHPEIFVQAEEPHGPPNTISKPRMHEKEFPVPNSILTTEEASILEYEFSKPELSDTVMCSDKELAEGSNQRLSTVKSCLREESCTNKCIEFSTNLISSSPLRVAEVGDFVEVNEELKPEDLPSSSPLRVTEVANLVVEMNELKAEDSPSNWSSDILERAAEDGSSLPKEQSSVISADVCDNQSRIAKDESEFRKEIVSVGVDTELINKGELGKDDVVAEGSTVDEEKLTAEVGVCGRTGQEHDIRNHSAEFAESDELDKDSRSAFKEDGEASFADLTNRTVSMIFTEEKDDTMHPEIFVQAEEPHGPPNTISKPRMHEKEFPVPNSILTTEEASILEYEFSKPELSDTVMCSDKELAEGSNQRLSTVKSCLREESCTNKCIEFSTNLISSSPLRVAEVGDFVEVNEELKPEDLPSSSPLRVTEVANLVVEMNELKAEDSPSNWSSDILERAAEDGSSLPKEQSSVISADVCDNQSRIAKDESEFRKEIVSVGVDTELINKGEYSAVDILERELEETVFEDTDDNDFERTSSLHGDAHHTLDSQLVERKGELEEMARSISGDVEERRLSKNIGREKTPVISEDDVDRDVSSCPVINHELPSNVVDYCLTPSEDSSGKEQVTDMSMVKSSRNFGKEFSSQLDYCQRPLMDSCGKEPGTPMSMVKSSKNCGEEFSSQHDNIIEQVKVSDVATLPQTICEDFAGFDNQMVADLIGSTDRQISSTGALNDGKIEDTEPNTVTDNKVLEDDIETVKGNSSNLVRNLVEDCGGDCEKSDAEIISYVSEEDRYGKDTSNSRRFDDTLQQFDVNYGKTNSNLKGKCQERPYLVQMDVNSNSVESPRDSLIAVDTIHRDDHDADVSVVPTEGLPRNENAMDSDAPANLLYGGERATLSGKTKQGQGLPTEELPRNEGAMDDADVPAHLQYCRESLTITGETNQVQERGPEEISFFSDIFGSELKSRSDEVDGEESDIWFDDDTFMLDKSGDAGKELDFSGFSTEEQLRNSGEGHGREKGPESIENQHAAFNNPSTGDDNISVENTLNESYLESEAHKDVHQKVDSCINNTFDEDFTRTES